MYIQVLKVVYTNYEVPWRPIQHVYDSKNAHGSTPPKRVHSNAKVIFVQLPDVDHLTGTTDCVRQLLGPVAPRTVNVKFRKLV